MNLPADLKKWIKAVIKQREYLVRHGISKKNTCKMVENMDYLRRYLNYYQYKTDRSISVLFQQNKDRILSLLPGESSSGHDKRMKEFNNYDQVTREVLGGSSWNQHRGIHPGSAFSSRSTQHVRPSI